MPTIAIVVRSLLAVDFINVLISMLAIAIVVRTLLAVAISNVLSNVLAIAFVRTLLVLAFVNVPSYMLAWSNLVGHRPC